MSTIKVDTIATRTGSGNITVSNNIAGGGTISGTNITASGTLGVSGTAAITGNSTVGGTLGVTGLITASAGVAIGGTGAANTLDDYEEGTWTPTLASGGSLSGGGGYYTKVGRLVSVWCSYTIASKSGSGQFIIGGLPFTASTNFGSQGAVRNQGVNSSSYGNVFVVEMLAGTVTARFHYPSSSSSQLVVQIGDVSVGDFNAWGLTYDV